jgi:hypothetical protein
MPARIEIDLQPKQRQLLDMCAQLDVVNIGFGGPRGGGKSRGMRDVMLARRLQHPKTVGWLWRRTFDSVYDNHIKRYFEERPYMREWYSASHKTFTLPNGSSIIFKHNENEDALITAEYGKEAMDIFIDQAEQFSERETNFLRTCRRFPGVPDGLCKMVSTINPGGRSHEYQKRVFIDQMYEENEIPSQFGFILASGWDNVEWVQQALAEDGFTVLDFYGWPEDRRFEYFINRSQYGRDLNALPERERAMQLLGRWDCFEGQVFPELGKVHDIDTYFDTAHDFSWRQFHEGMRLIGGMDHASTGISAFVMAGVDVDENLFGLEEYYQANRLISEHADGIKTLKKRYHTPDYSVIDPSTEAKTLQGKDSLFSVQDAYRREGLIFLSAHRASISVGIDRLKELLKVQAWHRNPFTQELGSPRLFISRRRCPNLWKEMTELRTEEGKFLGRDHATDDLRYIAMSRPAPAVVQQQDIGKLPQQVQFEIRSHEKWSQAFDRALPSANSETYWPSSMYK